MPAAAQPLALRINWRTIVRYREFLSDTEKISHDVGVGHTGWETVLENNKQAFCAGVCAALPICNGSSHLTDAAQFIDQLNANAGDVLSRSERARAIGLFEGATDTSNTTARALALRQVSEDEDLAKAEFNRAFVLMQYFGYLRRKSKRCSDSDYTGYDFWLTKLNQFNGNFVNAEMVKAFISSGEYRQRFGP